MRALKRKMRQPVVAAEKKKKEKKDKAKKDKKHRWDTMADSEKPFIDNRKKQYKDRPFEKGYGIDFYILGMRYLPDNVTACKIAISYVN